jgi:acyl-CoA thioesterase-1
MIMSWRMGASWHDKTGDGNVHALAIRFLAFLLFLAALSMSGEAFARQLRLAALGDSLTAGWGLRPDESFTAVLEKELRARGFSVEVLNFGISGDTTAGGVSRVGAVIAAKPDAAILELGANDALRGLDPALAEANLDQILAAFRKADMPVLLTGMRAIMGMGKRYGEEFAAIYQRLSAKHGVALYPFFLEGVAGDPALNLPDGLHPNAAGIREVVRRILPSVEAFLKGLPPAR